MNGLKHVIKKFPRFFLLIWLCCSLVAPASAGVTGLLEQYNEGLGNLESFFDAADKEDFLFVQSGGNESGPPDVSKNPVTPDDEGDSLPTYINLFLLGVIILFIIILTIIFDILGLFSGILKKPLINWNYINAIGCIIFLIVAAIASVWDFATHGPLTVLAHDAASVHGKDLDNLFFVTLVLTGIVFVITQILLFYFAFKYRHRDGKRAFFYADNHRLEQIWTLVPAVVLTVLILYGLKTWRNITSAPPANTAQIEVFAYQFGWAARYPGADGKLGNNNYNFISDFNPLGVAVREVVRVQTDSLTSEIQGMRRQIVKMAGFEQDYDHSKAINDLDGRIHSKDFDDDMREKYAELKHLIELRELQLKRINGALTANTMFENGDDDIVTQEIHVPIDEDIELKFRARDVIHSAFLPHFRVQMNCVPGIPTSFWFRPSMTTAQMRDELKNPDFDYYMICAKLCGSAHFNMKIKFVVESKADYLKWLKDQKPTFQKTVETPTPQDSASMKKLATAATINN
jgi:cytochrome c oxidase subunit 2